MRLQSVYRWTFNGLNMVILIIECVVVDLVLEIEKVPSRLRQIESISSKVQTDNIPLKEITVSQILWTSHWQYVCSFILWRQNSRPILQPNSPSIIEITVNFDDDFDRQEHSNVTRGGSRIFQRVGTIYYSINVFSENYMRMKNFWSRRGGGVPGAPLDPSLVTRQHTCSKPYLNHC